MLRSCWGRINDEHIAFEYRLEFSCNIELNDPWGFFNIRRNSRAQGFFLSKDQYERNPGHFGDIDEYWASEH
jgi:hypothetical protein